jgi:hypothetical protein
VSQVPANGTYSDNLGGKRWEKSALMDAGSKIDED